MAKVGFFEESEGVKSSTRLNYTFGIFSTFILAGFMVYTKAGGPVEVGTFLTVTLAALGGLKYFGTKNEKSGE